MHVRRICELRPAQQDGLVSRLLALQIIRRALAEPAAESSDWRDIGNHLRHAHVAMLRYQGIGLVVGDQDALSHTRHERRLLRATAAAQLPDPVLVDNYVFSLAPGRTLRPLLTWAVERLATGLTHHGHHLTFARGL